MPYITRIIEKFIYGTIDSISEKKLPLGAYSSALNFLTIGNRVELRRGYLLLGTLITGAGKITGLHVTYKNDGTELLFRKRGRKLEYYDTVTSDWIETSTNLFPVAAEDDIAFFANYQTNAGAQMFVSSPNSGLYKIMTANPGSYTDLTDASLNHKGYIKIKYNRMFLWGRTADRLGLYGSHIDEQNYTTVTGEATTSLTGTLAFKAAGALRTCFAVAITITAGGEVYTDNYDGTLTGSAGGTGTINYTTGAYTLSAAGVGTAAYQWENSNSGGVGDFTESGTRIAGEGFILRQDDGGALQNIFFFAGSIYCAHEYKTWVVTIPLDDTDTTNIQFRENIGIPSVRGGIDTDDGIYLFDYSNKKDPQIKRLRYDSSGQVVPDSISKGRMYNRENVGLDLAGYTPTDAVMFAWGDVILCALFTEDTTANNRVIVYNRQSRALDILDYYASVFVSYNGAMVAGDSLSNNVYELFSGLDDDGSTIGATLDFGLSDLELMNLKKNKRLVIQGLIGTNQKVKVYAAIDNSGFVELLNDGDTDAIDGQGSYVDSGQAVSVGAVTVGKKETGGGGSSITAFNFLKEIKVGLGKFERIKLRFVPQDLGWFSIDSITFKRIKIKEDKIPQKYR